MGPRSHERGNAEWKISSRAFAAGFNGAAFSRTRKRCGRLYQCGRHPQASMGPRSHERGNGEFPCAFKLLGGASMGPRSHERGNRSHRRRRQPCSPCFNGAAFSRTRKLKKQRVDAAAMLASMGPRSHERGNLPTSKGVCQGGAASMGPRSHERGNGKVVLCTECQGRIASMGPRSHERGNPIR